MNAGRQVSIGNPLMVALDKKFEVGRDGSGNVRTERNNLGNVPPEVPADEQTQLDFGSPIGVSELAASDPASFVTNAERQVSIGNHLLVVMDNMSEVGRDGSGNVGTELNISGNTPPEVPADEQTQLNFGSPRSVDDESTGDSLNKPPGVTEDHQASIAGEIAGLIVPPDLSRMSPFGEVYLERIVSNDAERHLSYGNHLLATMDNVSEVGSDGSGNVGTELINLGIAPPEGSSDEQTQLNFGSRQGVSEPTVEMEDHPASITGDTSALVILPNREATARGEDSVVVPANDQTQHDCGTTFTTMMRRVMHYLKGCCCQKAMSAADEDSVHYQSL